MPEIENLIRPHLRNHKPYSSARDEFYGEEKLLLDANESPYGDFNRYPDPYQNLLKEKVSKLKDVGKKNIFLGNGSDEIIDLLIRLFCNPGVDKVMVFEPTFGMYETAALVNDVEAVRINLNENFQINTNEAEPFLRNSKLKIIFLCSPNNPTGNLIERSEIRYLLKNFGGTIVIDEAYIDFSTSNSWISEIQNNPNLIVLQTLSKAYAMAGLRVGMAFANPKIIKYLNRIKSPYNLSSANQKLALEQLEKQLQIQEQIKSTILERERVADALADCVVTKKIHPSDANFLLVEVTDANKVYRELVQQKIIIRNRDRQVKNCLRITIGTPEQNQLLIEAFQKLTP